MKEDAPRVQCGRTCAVHRALTSFSMCSGAQKMWASSCWKRRRRVMPPSAPVASLRWSDEKSASRIGSSRYETARCNDTRPRGSRTLTVRHGGRAGSKRTHGADSSPAQR